MKLRVARLEEGEHHFSYESGSASWLREMIDRNRSQEGVVQSPLNVDIWLTKSEPDYLLRGRIAYSLQRDCSRCADTIAMPVEHPFTLALANTRTAPAVAESKADESEELDVVFFEGDEILLDPIVQEQLVLSFPYQTLCNDSCRGICQYCGTNLNSTECSCAATNPLSPFAALVSLKPSQKS